MKYVFHVRNWNVDFFLALGEILNSKSESTSIQYLTMTFDCYKVLKKHNCNAYYLPDELKKVKMNNEFEIDTWEEKFKERFGFGINYLFQIERFKPNKEVSLKFINNHVKWFADNIKSESILVSLTCDHLVYFISGIINTLKSGENYYVQPIGFPVESQVIMKNPWELNSFRPKALYTNYLEDYIKSLTLAPEKSIHYMKPQKRVSLSSSIQKRIQQLFTPSVETNMFAYLEEKSKNLIPGRFKNTKPNTNLYSDVSDLSILNANNIFYFPLQFEPEMSILAYSPWYQDQIEVIRLISQSMKIGDVLLLKENPKMMGKRSEEFYKKVNSFYNVFWADLKMNSREIIKNCFKTISITGTASIEAACLGKNSLIFGYPPFKNLLVEKPISSQRISNFIEILYKDYSAEEIDSQIKKGWGQFSKSLFFGNFIPTLVDEKISLKDSKSLAKRFYKEVLSL